MKTRNQLIQEFKIIFRFMLEMDATLQSTKDLNGRQVVMVRGSMWRTLVFAAINSRIESAYLGKKLPTDQLNDIEIRAAKQIDDAYNSIVEFMNNQGKAQSASTFAENREMIINKESAALVDRLLPIYYKNMDAPNSASNEEKPITE